MPRKIRYQYIARLIDHAAQIYQRGRTYPGDVILFHALSQPRASSLIVRSAGQT